MIKNALTLIRGLQRPILGMGIPAVYCALVIFQVISQGTPIPDAFVQLAVGIAFFAAGVRTAEKANPTVDTP